MNRPADHLPVPLAFALLFVAWPPAFGVPTPWRVGVGLVWWTALAAWGVGVRERAEGDESEGRRAPKCTPIFAAKRRPPQSE